MPIVLTTQVDMLWWVLVLLWLGGCGVNRPLGFPDAFITAFAAAFDRCERQIAAGVATVVPGRAALGAQQQRGSSMEPPQPPQPLLPQDEVGPAAVVPGAVHASAVEASSSALVAGRPTPTAEVQRHPSSPGVATPVPSPAATAAAGVAGLMSEAARNNLDALDALIARSESTPAAVTNLAATTTTAVNSQPEGNEEARGGADALNFFLN